MASLDQAFEMLSHLGHGRRLEHADDTDIKMKPVVNARDDLRGQKRIPAQGEKIIMDTDLFARKYVGPDSGQLIFKRRTRGNERLRRNSTDF